MILLILIESFNLSGCVNARLIDVPKVIEVPKKCKAIAIPSAIPENLVLEISKGKVVKFDNGGAELIRSYAATRVAIKKWQE